MTTLQFYSLVAAVAIPLVMCAPVTQESRCATCPSTDTAGNVFVAGSGGTLGVPRFCGYSTDATGASGPQTICFYNNSGGLFSSMNSLCPATAPLIACPPFVS